MPIVSILFLLAFVCAVIGFSVAVPFAIQRYLRGLEYPGTVRLIGSIVVYAVILGVIGFVLGFHGPMILTPDANQGPLLGIFITGPLGVLLGIGIGCFRAFRRAVPDA